MQVTAYYAPQFDALRELIVEGGQPVFLACLSRCKKWLSQGGKSNVYFAKTRDERYVVKQLTRSEKQSFLDFAPAYFRSQATLHWFCFVLICLCYCLLHRVVWEQATVICKQPTVKPHMCVAASACTCADYSVSLHAESS